MNAMNNIEIRDIVESIGKEAFVSIFYPEVKANPNITGAEISKKYPDRKYTSWNMRTSFTKKLFDYGVERDALKIVLSSSKLKASIVQKAESYLKE